MTSTYRLQVVEEIDKIAAEHLPAILVVIRAFRQSVTFKSAEASFRHGWKEGLDGGIHPESELWTELDAE